MRRAPALLAAAAFAVGTIAPEPAAASAEAASASSETSSSSSKTSSKSASKSTKSSKTSSKSAKSSSSSSKTSSKSAKSASSSSKSSSKSASKSSRGKRTAAKRKSKKRKPREVSRTPNRRTATNMPRGWSWPPSKAMVKAGERCTAALDAVGVGWRPAPAEGKIVTPILLDSLHIGGIDYHPVFRKPPFPMDCHLALALITHSPALHGLGVRKVSFGSIFRFTKVRAFGKTKNVLSRHALGLAMDVVSFEDAGGIVRVVKKDYPLGDEMLIAVEDTLNGSGGFRTVLTPRNDPTSHHDHFHIEADVSYYDDERHLSDLPPRGGQDEVAADGADDDDAPELLPPGVDLSDDDDDGVGDGGNFGGDRRDRNLDAGSAGAQRAR